MCGALCPSFSVSSPNSLQVTRPLLLGSKSLPRCPPDKQLWLFQHWRARHRGIRTQKTWSPSFQVAVERVAFRWQDLPFYLPRDPSDLIWGILQCEATCHGVGQESCVSRLSPHTTFLFKPGWGTTESVFMFYLQSYKAVEVFFFFFGLIIT